MKISRNFLKQIIVEEIRKLHEEEQYEEKIIDFSTKDFLTLTVDETENMYPFSILKQRLKKQKELEPNIESILNDKLKSIALVVDQNGKVIDHEGRLRMYYLSGQSKIIDDLQKWPDKLEEIDPKKKQKITFKYNKNFDISKKKLFLINQFNDEISIEIDNPLFSGSQEKAKEDLFSELIGNYKKDQVTSILRKIYRLLLNKDNTKEQAIEQINTKLAQYDISVNNIKYLIKMFSEYNIRIYKEKDLAGNLVDPLSNRYYPLESDKIIKIEK